MNLKQTIFINDDKLLNSELCVEMNDFQEQVNKFPLNYIQTKPTRMKKLVEIYGDFYDLHSIFKETMDQYGNSIILITNDNCVKYLVEESASYAASLEFFYKQVKQFSSCQELNQYYKQFTLKTSMVKRAFIEDIKRLSVEHSFEINIKELSKEFDLYKEVIYNQFIEA